MAFNKQSIVFALVVSLVVLFGGCYGDIYTVGDDFEWLVMSNDTYSIWSASKTFHVGDTLFFRYSYLDHNVMQVKHDQYESCNSTSPLAIYETGHDFITLETLGHLYFICGFPKHCEFGQKVDINVVPTLSPASSPSPPQATLSPPIQSPFPTPISMTPTSSLAPSPTENTVISLSPASSPSPTQAILSPPTQSPSQTPISMTPTSSLAPEKSVVSLSPDSSPSPTQATLSPPIQSPSPTPISMTPTSSLAPSPTEKSAVSLSPASSPSPSLSQAADSEIPNTPSPPKKNAASVTTSTIHYSVGSLVLASVISYFF